MTIARICYPVEPRYLQKPLCSEYKEHDEPQGTVWYQEEEACRQRRGQHGPGTSAHRAFVLWDHSAKWGQRSFSTRSRLSLQFVTFRENNVFSRSRRRETEKSGSLVLSIGRHPARHGNCEWKFLRRQMRKHRVWSMSIMRLSFIAVRKQNKRDYNTNKCHSLLRQVIT